MQHDEREHEQIAPAQEPIGEHHAPAATEGIHDAGMVASSSESGGDYDAQGATAGSRDEAPGPDEEEQEASGRAEGPAQTQEPPSS